MRTGHGADSAPPCERMRSELQSAEPLWEAFCNLPVSRFSSLGGRFLTSARGDRGGMKTPGKEEGNMKPDDWAVIGLKRQTICPRVDEMRQNPPILTSSTFGFVILNISSIRPPLSVVQPLRPFSGCLPMKKKC